MKKAVNFGIVGSGRAGNKIAGEFFEFGYPTLIINTAEQDLDDIKCDNKLCIGNGGAGRDLRIGAEAVNLHRSEIMNFYHKVFTDVDHIMIVASSSGGCIDGESVVFTTYCGGEQFKTLFEKITQNKPLWRHPFNNGLYCDISDLNIFVPSLEDSKFNFNKATQIWKFNVPKEQQIELTFNDNSVATTSEWHKFPVLRKGELQWIESKNIQLNDVVINGKLKNWIINEYLYINDIKIDENIAWMIGMLCGDGCICNTQNRWRVRFKNPSNEVLDKITKIMAKLGFNCNKPYKPINNKATELTFSNKDKVEWLKELSELNYGHKNQWHIPKFIWKSPKSVISAFLAGLIDSDGHVQTDKFNIKLSFTSKNIENEFPALINLVYGLSVITQNYNPKTHKCKKNNDNWNINYILNIRGKETTNEFIKEVINYMTVPHKIQHMNNLLSKQPSGGYVENIPINFNDIDECFKLLGYSPFKTRTHHSFYNWKLRNGIPSKSTFLYSLDMLNDAILLIRNTTDILKQWDYIKQTPYGVKAVNLNSYSIRKSLYKYKKGKIFDKIMLHINKTWKILIENTYIVEKKINTWKSFLSNMKYVTKKQQPIEAKVMYDFTIPNSQNYLAGYGGLTVIHNSGGGSLKNIIDTVADFKKPCGVITTFPLSTEDTRCKKNTLAVLNDLIKLSIEKKISPLIIIDNDKIEKKYPGLSTIDFWTKANKEVVKCFHLFNVLSARNSKYVSFDPANYKKVLFSGGCMIFGNVTITPEVINEDTIADAIRDNLNSGLLAEGFNLVEATHAAFIVMGNKNILASLPMKASEKANSMLMQQIGSGTVFKGVYEIDTSTNVEIIMMLSGLGLPKLRIKEIIDTAKQETQHLEKKTQLKTVDDILNEIENEKK